MILGDVPMCLECLEYAIVALSSVNSWWCHSGLTTPAKLDETGVAVNGAAP